MDNTLIVINKEICRKEGLCVRVCPKVFTQDGAGGVPVVSRPEFCNDCGHCLLICPTGAIKHERIAPAGVHPVDKGLLPSFEQVQELIRTRRSVRNFLDRPVERELIGKVVDCARFAPSAKNTQSTRFIVVDDRDVLEKIASMTAGWLGRSVKKLKNPLIRTVYLMRGMVTKEEYSRWIGQFELIAGNMDKGVDGVLYNAPALILFHADKRTRFAEANANLALQNATFAACALGLGSFYTGYVVLACAGDRAMRKLIGVPGGHRIYAGLTLGHPKTGFSRWIERNPAKIRWI